MHWKEIFFAKEVLGTNSPTQDTAGKILLTLIASGSIIGCAPNNTQYTPAPIVRETPIVPTPYAGPTHIPRQEIYATAEVEQLSTHEQYAIRRLP